MAFPIDWSPRAIQAVREIFLFISDDSPQAALRMRQLLQDSVIPLSGLPYLGRPGKIAGSRELIPHPNYIVIYQVLADHILILDVVHARRQYP